MQLAPPVVAGVVAEDVDVAAAFAARVNLDRQHCGTGLLRSALPYGRA